MLDRQPKIPEWVVYLQNAILLNSKKITTQNNTNEEKKPESVMKTLGAEIVDGSVEQKQNNEQIEMKKESLAMPFSLEAPPSYDESLDIPPPSYEQAMIS